MLHEYTTYKARCKLTTAEQYNKVCLSCNDVFVINAFNCKNTTTELWIL